MVCFCKRKDLPKISKGGGHMKIDLLLRILGILFGIVLMGIAEKFYIKGDKKKLLLTIIIAAILLILLHVFVL